MDALDYPLVVRLLAAAWAAVSLIGGIIFVGRAMSEMFLGGRPMLRTQLAAALGAVSIANATLLGGFSLYLATPSGERPVLVDAIEPFIILATAVAIVATVITIRSITVERHGERIWLSTVVAAAAAVTIAVIL